MASKKAQKIEKTQTEVDRDREIDKLISSADAAELMAIVESMEIWTSDKKCALKTAKRIGDQVHVWECTERFTPAPAQKILPAVNEAYKSTHVMEDNQWNPTNTGAQWYCVSRKAPRHRRWCKVHEVES